jgi:hypothetical protein
MAVGSVAANSLALEMVRSALQAKSTAQSAHAEVAVKALDLMKAEGQAAVDLIDSAAPHLGRNINVRA